MNFTNDQLKHYDRNILLNGVGLDGQKKLAKAKVFIAGSGGLGSPVISYLSTAGVGHITILDSDIIELSNLNRQFLHSVQKINTTKVESAKEFVSSLNPNVKVTTIHAKLSIDNVLSLIDGHDCVIDCLDKLHLSFLLNDACIEKNIPFVHAGVVSFCGQIMTILPGESACLRCLIPVFPEKEPGPRSTDIGILGACAGVIGSLEAVEAVKILLNKETLSNRVLFYDGIKTSFKKINIAKNQFCCVCSKGNMLPKESYQVEE